MKCQDKSEILYAFIAMTLRSFSVGMGYNLITRTVTRNAKSYALKETAAINSNRRLSENSMREAMNNKLFIHSNNKLETLISKDTKAEFQAYEKGLMIAVIPFTKILEPCQSSLKARVREVEGNPVFSNKDIGASHPQMVAEMNPAIMPTSTHSGGHMNALSQYPAGLHLASATKELVLKEPLRGSISSLLRNSFQRLNIANELLEQDVPLVMNDSLDLGCVVVENAATDKALQTIGASYYDSSMYTQGPMGLIPEALRPRPGHLSYSQQWAYEFNSGFYSSGFSSTGSSMITQPVDLITEEMNPSSAQFYSGSYTRIGSIDGVNPHGVKHSSVALFPSPAAGSELHSVEASCTVEVHEANQDQITRVLLEWLIVSRPHPYNLH